MSEIIKNLKELKDKVKVEDAADDQQAPETPEVPEQGKKTLKDRFAEAKKASVTKKIEKEQKKIAKLEQKLVPVEKTKKVKIDKTKLLVGAGIGTAILGSIGAMILKGGATGCEETTCEGEETADCCEQPYESESNEVQETEA